MNRIIAIVGIALMFSLSGCYVAPAPYYPPPPPVAYAAPAPYPYYAPGYYAPAYYGGPVIGIGFGGGYWHHR